MDDLIYTAMSGAKALMQRQDVLTHNLANASTGGFRADLAAFRAVPVRAEGTATTRVALVEATTGFDQTAAPTTTTGRSLDLAIRGNGWFVVQARDGTETYTRDGNFTLGRDGSLQTQAGLTVLGSTGPLLIPENAEITIGADGTVTTRVGVQPATQVGRLRLANPDPATLKKGEDGLIRSANGNPAPDDPAVRVIAGALEGSNVNVVESMVGMIALSRQFEMQMKMMQNAEANEQRAAQLLSVTS